MRASGFEGFFLCGIVLLLTDDFDKISSVSPISVICNKKSSFPILPNDLLTSASTEAYSARTSLAGCQSSEKGLLSLSSSIINNSVFLPFSPKPKCVPTAPFKMPDLAKRLCTSFNLSMFRRFSPSQVDTFLPKVMGNACCPLVLPAITVSRCFIARVIRVASTLRR